MKHKLRYGKWYSRECVHCVLRRVKYCVRVRVYLLLQGSKLIKDPAPIVQLSLSDCTKISSRRLRVSKYLSRLEQS